MMETLLKHRTIRKYKNDSIPDSDMKKCLEAAVRASTTGNMQVYSIIVTTDKELKKQLWEAHFKQNMVLEAPAVITFCADFNRFNKWCLQRKAQPGYDNFLSFYTASIDALLAAQNFCVAAESLGYGICYLGTATYMADKIIQILNIPKGVVPVTAVVVGVPNEDPGLTDRLPLEAVVHNEKYKDYLSEDIDRMYKEKEELEFTKELLKQNKKETLAQIFTDNRYTKKDNEFFSEKYMNVIRTQGFIHEEEK